MVFNQENKNTLKAFILKLKLKKLEQERSNVIVSFIALNPKRAAKTDNLEKIIDSKTFDLIEFKINAINRLLVKISKN